MSRAAVPPPRPVPPPIPASQLPQFVAPSRASKALQLSSFVLGAGITIYATLIYDFGPNEHCFMPLRRWVDENTKSFFTLSEQDRKRLNPTAASIVQPSTQTPVEFFKERREAKESGKP